MPTTTLAYTQPFTFHCTGNACRVVGFLDEGNGCVIATNTSHYPVRITFGAEHRGYDVRPGETEAPINDTHCAGYYEGGETADFIGPAH